MSNNWKKIIVALSVSAFFLCTGQAFAQSDEWKKVADDVNKNQDKALEDVAGMEKFRDMDMAALKKELANLKAQDKREDLNLKKLEKDFDSFRKVEKQHIKDLEDEQEEIRNIEDTVLTVVKDAVSTSRDNPITAEFPERKEILGGISDSKEFPGMDWIKTLVAFYFQEMEEAAKILRRSGEFVGPDGKMTTGEIIRVGRFTTYYRLADGSVGFLTPEADGRRLVAVTGEAPRYMLKAISNYFERKDDVPPVDFTNGAYFVKLTQSESYAEKLEIGGAIMYVILGVGIFAILLGLERMIVLGTKSRASDKVMEEIKEMAGQGKWGEAREYCSSKSRIPTCQMLDNALAHVGYSQEVLENALQESILKQVPKLERFLPTLALFAVISPLLGLLGTVSGMIDTFSVIMEVGTGDANAMAGGISTALLTTQFGLTVAIPIMLVHHFLKSQVDKIVLDMQEKGTAFAITLIKHETVKKED